jgi:uncharacterized protein YjbK
MSIMEHRAERNVETEIKLALEKKKIKALLNSPLILRKTVKDSTKDLKLVTIYYDTPDLNLQKAGLAYRVRQCGKKYEATVKTDKASSGGISCRSEYNIPLEDAHPVVAGFAEQGLEADLPGLIGDEALLPLFKVSVKRQVRLLNLSKTTKVELAVDQGQILAGKKRDKILEIELELKSGKLSELLAYTAQLAGEVPLFPEKRSKYVRGLALLGQEVKLEIPEKGKLDSNSPVREAFEDIILRRCEVIMDGQKKYLELLPKESAKPAVKLKPDKKAAGLTPDKNLGSGKAEDERKMANLRADADKLFLERINRLNVIMYWALPLLHDGLKMQKYIEEIRLPLADLHEAKYLLLLWKQIAVFAAPEPGADKLTELLAGEVRQAALKVTEQIRAGLYTKFLFKLLAQIEDAKWKNEDYLDAGQLLNCRAESINNALLGLVGLPEEFAQEKCHKALEYVGALDQMKGLYKLPSWTKATPKYLKKLHKLLLKFTLTTCRNKTVTEKILNSREQEVVRQGGILLGWLYNDRYRTVKKIFSAYEKLTGSMEKR